MTALEFSRQHHDFCIQALSSPLDQECVDISYTPTLVWHPISWSVYENYDCISEDPPCSLLCLNIDVNCRSELPTVLWSVKIWHNSRVESDLARALLISATSPLTESFVFQAHKINRLSHH